MEKGPTKVKHELNMGLWETQNESKKCLIHKYPKVPKAYKNLDPGLPARSEPSFLDPCK